YHTNQLQHDIISLHDALPIYIHSTINNLKPQQTLGSDLIYRYDKEASFSGGNEYLYFDSKDIRATGNGIQRVEISDLYDHFLYRSEEHTSELQSRLDLVCRIL